MSAYIVEKNHIVYLVTAAMSRRLNMHGGSFSWNRHGTGPYARAELPCSDYPRAAEVGNMLWNENIASVSARYPNESSATLPGPIGGSFVITERDFKAMPAQIDPVQVLKSCDCLEYQSCEHDGWMASEAHDFLRSLRKHAYQSLPGYEAAEWGAPAPEARGLRIA